LEDAWRELEQVNKEKYEGQMSKGLKHGQGSLLYPETGEIYKGAFRSDQRHGNGVCLFQETGVIYKGDWREDQPYGHGLLYCPTNEVVEANFQNGRINDGKIKILVSNY
jgi:hypothetical protein